MLRSHSQASTVYQFHNIFRRSVEGGEEKGSLTDRDLARRTTDHAHAHTSHTAGSCSCRSCHSRCRRRRAHTHRRHTREGHVHDIKSLAYQSFPGISRRWMGRTQGWTNHEDGVKRTIDNAEIDDLGAKSPCLNHKEREVQVG